MELMEVSTLESVPVGFKRTELGLIPIDWEVKRLGDIGDCLIGLTYSPSQVREHGTLVLRSSNVFNGKLVFDDNVFVEANIPDRIMVREKDILICVRNGSRELIGKTALIDSRATGMTFGAFMAVFRTHAAEFVYNQFQSEVVKRQIHEHLGATINQITNKSLKSFIVPYTANRAEQHAIATALSDADALLSSLEQLIAKKKAIKQGAMQALLTPPGQPGYKRLPGFEGEWEVKKLGAIGSFTKGKGIKKDEVRSSGLPCIRYGEIYTVHNDVIRRFYSFITKDTATESQRISSGDLLFAGSGETAAEIGKCVAFIDNFEAYAGGDIVILRPLGYNSVFLGYLMNHSAVVAQKERMGQGDAVVHISAANLSLVEVAVPRSPKEQDAIATILTDLDAELEALEQRLAKLRLVKQGMMQELLTGRKRLINT